MLILLAVFFLPLTSASADKSVPIVLNAGEATVITVPTGAAPEVNNGADAFSAQARKDGSLLVLGVQAGEGTIRVKDKDRVTIYHVTVHAIFDAKNRLAPGAPPTPISDEGLSGSRKERGKPASRLDPGAGPAARPSFSARDSSHDFVPTFNNYAPTESASGESEARSANEYEPTAGEAPAPGPALASAPPAVDAGAFRTTVTGGAPSAEASLPVPVPAAPATAPPAAIAAPPALAAA